MLRSGLSRIILTKKEEVAQALSEIVHRADAFYLTGSSIIGETVPIIVDIANKAKVITITHLDDLVEKGALIGGVRESLSCWTSCREKGSKDFEGREAFIYSYRNWEKTGFDY